MTHSALPLRLDARLALDERGGDLQDERLDVVGGRPALLRQQLHADGAAAEHEAVHNLRTDDAHERRLKREVVLEDEVKLDEVLRALAALGNQILTQRTVRVESARA